MSITVVLIGCFRPYHLSISSKTWAQKDEIFDTGENFYEYNFFMIISCLWYVIIKNKVNGQPLERTSNAPLLFYYFT